MRTPPTIHIIGAGLAGSEAAWQLARRQIPVRLYEMRPRQQTPAHQSGDCAELVCSNSLRSDDATRNAVGLLHAEMRLLGSLIMASASRHRLPAGGALAVDRQGFAAWITQELAQHPCITLVREELTAPPEDGITLLASGPLTSPPLAAWLAGLLGPQLAFFDAIAPIVSLESIDFSKAWKQSRYDKGGDDYINCPLDRAQYEGFVDALLCGEQRPFKAFEQEIYFEGCLPIEVMAGRGRETLRFGPMKPVGLFNPHQGGKMAHAVVQLRQDNQLGTLWNMVGFQTKLTWPAQQRIFRTIPGLEQAEFMRLGAIHRNLFIDSPRLLDGHLRLRQRPNLFFAGQMTGVEGYVESAATGLLAGLFIAEWLQSGTLSAPPPPSTAHGALLTHITAGAMGPTFQPMNVNFGLFPPLEQAAGTTGRKADRKALVSQRAIRDLQEWIAQKSIDNPPFV
ncbi:MAG: methylenetetrahydrofolate--tRNA-(uracil(54)-C(5))-methyltransferase (FADH(2)-oxidizing) TrmFO [Magnetococcales bacterium]|nr:methylenetetrahydrofolate--tRNA-(uracil(54)-C(5))-methyltransferase (FADH(2)-oxidizing) TrmFO [Magnetococcales bacterium]